MEEWGASPWWERSRISHAGRACVLLLQEHPLMAWLLTPDWCKKSLGNCCQLKCQPILQRVLLTNTNGVHRKEHNAGRLQGGHPCTFDIESTTEGEAETKRRRREVIALLTYQYLGVTNGVFWDGYPVSALLPLGWLAECISDSYHQFHSAASVPSVCCYNIATNACCLWNEGDLGYLQTILYKPRGYN